MMRPLVTSQFLAGPRGRILVRRCGTHGLPVIFVHGNGGRASQWDQQLVFLGEGHQAAALDLRGMGSSDPPWDSDFSVGALAADVAAVADHLQFERLYLVGHSLGASVVSCFAGLFPGRLHGLVLVDFGGDPRDDSPEEISWLMDGLAEANFEHFAQEAMATCLRGARAEVVTQVLDDLKATPRNSFAGAVLGLLDFDPVISLTNKGIRMLHLYSPFLEAFGLAPIHHRVQGIESQRLEDCSHWVHLDRPEAFAQALRRFVDHGSLRNPAS